MDRRDFMGGALALASSSLSGNAWSADKWGADQGYPTGWGGQFSRLPEYRVGNYSGGFEKMFPHHIIEKSTRPTAFDVNLIKDFKYKWGFFNKSPDEYLDS